MFSHATGSRYRALASGPASTASKPALSMSACTRPFASAPSPAPNNRARAPPPRAVARVAARAFDERLHAALRFGVVAGEEDLRARVAREHLGEDRVERLDHLHFGHGCLELLGCRRRVPDGEAREGRL